MTLKRLLLPTDFSETAAHALDYAREMALVAVIEADGEPKQLGVARYVINPDGRSCEFAIVVGDETQNMGLGSRLMTALFAAARDHGLAAMEGLVLADNRPMLTLMEDLGFSTRPYPDDTSCVVVEKRL